MERTYEVALWRRFRMGVLEFPVCGEIKACTPLLAIVALMSRDNVPVVMHASVAVAPGSIERWCMGRGFWVMVSA